MRIKKARNAKGITSLVIQDTPGLPAEVVDASQHKVANYSLMDVLMYGSTSVFTAQ